MIGVYIYMSILIWGRLGFINIYLNAASYPDVSLSLALSLDEHLRAKEGGREKTGFSSSHSPLRFITSHSLVNPIFAHLCAKNEAPA